MALDIITASTDRDLTSTSALKAMVLGATATSTVQDSYLSDLIRRASGQAESYIGQAPLSVQSYRETVAGFGRRRLMLSRTPVRAIEAIYSGTDTGTATQLETSEFIVENADAGLIARDAGFAWDAPLQWRGGGSWGGDAVPLDPAPMPGQEYRPWLVDYVAGWTYGGLSTSSDNWSTEAGTTDTGRTLPEDLELGVLFRAKAMRDGRDGIAAEKVGDIAVTYNLRSQSDDRLEPWQEALEPYVRLK